MPKRSNNGKTLSAVVQDEVRRRIVRGIYPPGQPLREMELEKQLGVSRNPVREALRLLIPTGLVEYRPWKGFRVKQYSPENIENLYRLRAVMEGMMVEQLRGRDVASLVRTLKLRSQSMKDHLRAKNADAYFEENLCFHQEIATAAGDDLMIQILNNVNEICLPARYSLILQEFPNQSAIRCHDEIITRLELGDLVAVRSLIEEHVLEDLLPVKESYSRAISGDPRPRPERPSRVPDEDS